MDYRLHLTQPAERGEAHDSLTSAAHDVNPAPDVPAAPSIREGNDRQPLLQILPPPPALPQITRNSLPTLASGVKRSAANAGLDADAVPNRKRVKVSHGTDLDAEGFQQAPPEGDELVIDRTRISPDADMDEGDLTAHKWLMAQEACAGAPFEMEKQLTQPPEKMALDMPFILPNAIDGDMQLIQAWLKTPGFDVNASYLVQAYGDLLDDAFSRCLVTLMPDGPDKTTALAKKSGDNKTALTLAIENSHFEMIHALLAVPGIIVTPDQVHRLCMLAAQEGDLLLLRLMLDRPGIDVNTRVDYSCPYLVLAAKNGHLPIVHTLLAVPGIDVNAWGPEIKTALLVAIQNNHRQIAMALVAMPGINVNAISTMSYYRTRDYRYGDYTALMMAAEKGNLSLVRTLLAVETIEVNLTFKNGCTPLMLAAYQGHLEIVQALLAMPGIDVRRHSIYFPVAGDTFVRDGYGPTNSYPNSFTAVSLAIKKDEHQIVEALLAMPSVSGFGSYGYPYEHLHGSERPARLKPAKKPALTPEERYRFVHRILYPGPDTALPIPTLPPQDALDLPRASWLEQKCMAISLGTCSASDVRFLLQSTIPLPAWCRSSLANAIALGFTAGHYRSARDPFWQIAQGTGAWLAGLAFGAKQSRQDAIELDAGIAHQLDAMRLWNGFLNTVEELQQLKVDPDKSQSDKLTLLGCASRDGDLVMIKTLVALGANIHLRSPNGDVPIVAAARAGQWAACAELLSLGAMPVMVDSKGYSALYHIASAFAHSDTATPALAGLIRYLRLKNIRFDVPVPEPMEQVRNSENFPTLFGAALDLLEPAPKKNPTVLVSDILVSNPQSWVLFGKAIYGIDHAPLPASATACAFPVQQSMALKMHVHAMFQSAAPEAALAAWVDEDPQRLHWQDPDDAQGLLHLATASQNIGLVQLLLNRGIARTHVDRAGQTAAQLLPADYMSSYTPAAERIASLLR